MTTPNKLIQVHSFEDKLAIGTENQRTLYLSNEDVQRLSLAINAWLYAEAPFKTQLFNEPKKD